MSERLIDVLLCLVCERGARKQITRTEPHARTLPSALVVRLAFGKAKARAMRACVYVCVRVNPRITYVRTKLGVSDSRRRPTSVIKIQEDVRLDASRVASRVLQDRGEWRCAVR